MCETLCLGFQHAVSVLQMIQMTGTDVGNDHDIRLRHARQAIHLLKIRDSHLHNCHFGFRRNGKERQWDTQFVVVIAGSFLHLIFFRQNGCNHLFRRGLADASRYTHDWAFELRAVKCSNLLKRKCRGCNLDIRSLTVRQITLCQYSKRTVF